MKKNDKKKKKRAFVDDGRTIYDMSGLNPDGKKDKEPIGLSRKERWAAIKAAFWVYGRVFLLVLIGFAIAGVFMWLWLQ
ncbi:MAG TPA: hypothetical protein H9690_04855 [Firmicutes bacterium]|nr:hypothetical protein [Bacillota bacterium]